MADKNFRVKNGVEIINGANGATLTIAGLTTNSGSNNLVINSSIVSLSDSGSNTTVLDNIKLQINGTTLRELYIDASQIYYTSADKTLSIDNQIPAVSGSLGSNSFTLTPNTIYCQTVSGTTNRGAIMTDRSFGIDLNVSGAQTNCFLDHTQLMFARSTDDIVSNITVSSFKSGNSTQNVSCQFNGLTFNGGGGNGGVTLSSAALQMAVGAFPPSNTSDIGMYFNKSTGVLAIQGSNIRPLGIGRTTDGNLIDFYSAGTLQGSISVSGATITYGPFCGVHITQTKENEHLNVPIGTVMETIGGSCVWDDKKDYRLPKVKICNKKKSKAVYGVFLRNDTEDNLQDFYVASLGAYYVRMANTVSSFELGDLVQSAGKGCAEIQSDDIVHSYTIGKIISNEVKEIYDDGSFIVSCALYCG